MGCGACKASVVSHDDEVPAGDVLRLVHFGTWLLKETEYQKHVLFVVLLVLGEKGLVDTSLVRFSDAFRQVLRTTSQDGRSSPKSDSFSNLKIIAQAELRTHWQLYLRTTEKEKFFSAKEVKRKPPSTSSLQDRAAFRNRTKSALSLVDGLMERDGRTRSEFNVNDIDLQDLDSEAAPEGSFWQASSAAESVVRALPLMIQAMHAVEAALKPMLLAVEDLLGDEPWLPSQADRCKYHIPAGGCVYTSSPGTKSMAFDSIGVTLLDGLCQERSGLTLDEIANELGSELRPSRTLSTNSKSGEIFLISHGGKFIIKTISANEAKALEEILPSYAEHLRGTGSILGLYVGLYQIDIGGENRYFTIMHSVFDSPIHVDSMYDLKGSTYHRRVKDASESVRKDQDWIDDGCRLELSEEDAKSLLEMHQRDTEFLSSCHIIDFSVLIGIAELEDSEKPEHAWMSKDGSRCYFIGIVDVLIEYGIRKRLEHLLHKMKGVGETASVTDPQSYSRRQQDFFRTKVLCHPSEEKSSEEARI
mmetsp:Transcript_85080/g.150444  ORF Transcript_85080/g.150444 Transcript_85080/m.150444 type:complete len:531 (+) Transcript_85080:21-1613(+)|eukprot:CAMPEP_0197622160 /NCGR_PEP_ID=MMETSP1338-20131121/2549_1 /TAXON_ID=43686 ORGANISM="Pelagodinium beii, Strain RCC1491" /NCGR_SAMPLE_ID=MMETSP1338 /ASSEMBLY_ACC=CAM_ASM_000754 /LENGTH=530 /DNA_ID=CAMNT_0043191829 /DNA_START=21 /DNA_END=1613 /DNA_ORIENTATION=+